MSPQAPAWSSFPDPTCTPGMLQPQLPSHQEGRRTFPTSWHSREGWDKGATPWEDVTTSIIKKKKRKTSVVWEIRRAVGLGTSSTAVLSKRDVAQLIKKMMRKMVSRFSFPEITRRGRTALPTALTPALLRLPPQDSHNVVGILLLPSAERLPDLPTAQKTKQLKFKLKTQKLNKKNLKIYYRVSWVFSLKASWFGAPALRFARTRAWQHSLGRAGGDLSRMWWCS